jgi:chromosome segregation ATPase
MPVRLREEVMKGRTSVTLRTGSYRGVLDQIPEMDAARDARARAEMAAEKQRRDVIRRQREEARQRDRRTQADLSRLDALVQRLLRETRQMQAEHERLTMRLRKLERAA